MVYFILKGSGFHANDYKKPEQEARNERIKNEVNRLPLEADPNHKHVKKIGMEVLKMKKAGMTPERIEKELGKEVSKYTKFFRC